MNEESDNDHQAVMRFARICGCFEWKKMMLASLQDRME
jgi:hypothetical protein